MKKNIYLTILTIVTVLCIIGGTCYHVIGWGVSLQSALYLFSNSSRQKILRSS